MDGWIYSKFPRRENVHIAYRRMRFFRRGSDLDAVAKGTKKEELIHSKLLAAGDSRCGGFLFFFAEEERGGDDDDVERM